MADNVVRRQRCRGNGETVPGDGVGDPEGKEKVLNRPERISAPETRQEKEPRDLDGQRQQPGAQHDFRLLAFPLPVGLHAPAPDDEQRRQHGQVLIPGIQDIPARLRRHADERARRRLPRERLYAEGRGDAVGEQNRGNRVERYHKPARASRTLNAGEGERRVQCHRGIEDPANRRELMPEDAGAVTGDNQTERLRARTERQQQAQHQQRAIGSPSTIGVPGVPPAREEHQCRNQEDDRVQVMHAASTFRQLPLESIAADYTLFTRMRLTARPASQHLPAGRVIASALAHASIMGTATHRRLIHPLPAIRRHPQGIAQGSWNLEGIACW
ncbi:MAG: hypothetical protein BWY76_00321 [bacterium ADurb.Bin429]|nr:MAG: hypothetical protein BWY76_00321 [bacterium ADurb.Bin429]